MILAIIKYVIVINKLNNKKEKSEYKPKAKKLANNIKFV